MQMRICLLAVRLLRGVYQLGCLPKSERTSPQWIVAIHSQRKARVVKISVHVQPEQSDQNEDQEYDRYLPAMGHHPSSDRAHPHALYGFLQCTSKTSITILPVTTTPPLLHLSETACRRAGDASRPAGGRPRCLYCTSCADAARRHSNAEKPRASLALPHSSTRSRSVATPCPTPTHSVAIP